MIIILVEPKEIYHLLKRFKKLKPNKDLQISASQMLQLRELKYNPFQKTIGKALGLNKDEFLLPIDEKVKYDKKKEDFLNNKFDPNVLTLNVNTDKEALSSSKNDMMFDDMVMKSKFPINSLTNNIRQERLAMASTNGNNNFIDEEDRYANRIFDYPQYMGELENENKLIGKQNITFMRFCTALKIFSIHALPEEKIMCK